MGARAAIAGALMVGLSVSGQAQLAVDTALAREAAALPGFFRSAVIVANPRAADATARMNFVKSDGSLALSSPLTFTVKAGATVQQYVPNIPSLADGRYSVVIDSDQSVVSVVNLASDNPLTSAAYNGIAETDAGTTYNIPSVYLPVIYKGYHGYDTSVNVQNVDAEPTKVTITYLNSGGATVTSETKDIQPGSFALFYQPNSALPDGFNGSAIVATNDGQSILAVANVALASMGYIESYNAFAPAAATSKIGTSGRIARRDEFSDYYVYDVSSPTASTLWATASGPGTSLGWAVGNDGVVIKTTDGGASWSVIANVPGETLTGVAAGSKSVVWVVGNKGTIYRSTNGGSSWVRQTPPSTGFTNVAAASESVAWVYGAVEGGVTYIAGTFDGGATWTTQYVDTSISNERHIGGFVATSPLEAWAVSTGQVLYTSNGGPETVRSALPLVPRNFTEGRTVPLPPLRR